MASPLSVSPSVADALASGTPIVALESTIIAHGLPRPGNLEAARHFEQVLVDAGVVPATIAVLDGELKAGLTPDELERIATEELPKLSLRDLPVVLARGGSGATTVAATSYIADHAGIRVFATGGLGGVHRGAAETFDESADLKVLADVPITVVSAGVKSILDIGGDPRAHGEPRHHGGRVPHRRVPELLAPVLRPPARLDGAGRRSRRRHHGVA